MTPTRIHRGSRFLAVSLDYNEICVITFERAVGSHSYLRIRGPRGSASIVLPPNDSYSCYEALRELCPHAAVIGADGKTLMPLHIGETTKVLAALAKEWKRRGRTYAYIAIVIPLLAVVSHLTGNGIQSFMMAILELGSLLSGGFGVLAIRAFRESSRIEKSLSTLAKST